MELINYKLFVDFIVPLFEGKTFDQYLIIFYQYLITFKNGSFLGQCHTQKSIGQIGIASTKNNEGGRKYQNANRKSSGKNDDGFSCIGYRTNAKTSVQKSTT